MGIIGLGLILGIILIIKMKKSRISAVILALMIFCITITITSGITNLLVDDMDEDIVHIRMDIEKIAKVKFNKDIYKDVEDFTFYVTGEEDIDNEIIRYQYMGMIRKVKFDQIVVRTDSDSFDELGLSKYNVNAIDTTFKNNSIDAVIIRIEPVFDIDKKYWLISFPFSPIENDSIVEKFGQLIILKNDDMTLTYYNENSGF